MVINQNVINKLLTFKNKDKFSSKEWDKRGLIQPEIELCNELTRLFNHAAQELIDAVSIDFTDKQLIKILKSNLLLFEKRQYDTEEKEFIIDVFFELSEIIEIDFKNSLNRWLYGSILTNLMKVQKLLKPERIIETLLQPCTKCGVELETYVLSKHEGIPTNDWLIVKCNNCGELNLLLPEPGIAEMKFGNYQWFDKLSITDYNYEQALTRLAQIKFYKKD